MPISRLVTALAMTAALAACSGDPEPRVAPTETPSATPQPTAEPTDAPLPDLDPEETVRAWVDARNEALADGDTQTAQGLSGEDCDSCRNLLASIEKVYGADGLIRSEGWTVVSSRVASRKDSRAEVRTAVRFAAGEMKPSADAPTRPFAAENHLMIFDLSRADTDWTVESVVFLS